MWKAVRYFCATCTDDYHRPEKPYELECKGPGVWQCPKCEEEYMPVPDLFTSGGRRAKKTIGEG